jgi:hypothetical protein
MTDDELWALVVAAEKATDEAQLAQRAASSNELNLAERAALRDRVAETALVFTRLTNQWKKRTRGGS